MDAELDDMIMPDDFDEQDKEEPIDKLMAVVDKSLNKMGYHDNTTQD